MPSRGSSMSTYDPACSWCGRCMEHLPLAKEPQSNLAPALRAVLRHCAEPTNHLCGCKEFLAIKQLVHQSYTVGRRGVYCTRKCRTEAFVPIYYSEMGLPPRGPLVCEMMSLKRQYRIRIISATVRDALKRHRQQAAIEASGDGQSDKRHRTDYTAAITSQ